MALRLNSTRVFALSTRAAIAATAATAQAVADLRALSVSVILIAVILLPLAQAAWMPAT